MSHNRTSARRAAAKHRRRLDPLVRRMYADYRRGVPCREIARRYGERGVFTIYGLFKIRGLRCDRGLGPEHYARLAANRRARLDAIALQAHADYERPLPLKAVARKYETAAATLRMVFARNGLPVRSFKKLERQPNGSPMRLIPKAEAEIEALIAKATRLQVPPALAVEWRSWSLERRGCFAARLRKRLHLPNRRPVDPFSDNVEPFDYGTPRAHAIVKVRNVGRTSRTKRGSLRIGSQGVIYKDRLFFWNRPRGFGVGYYSGPWRGVGGRPALHRIIWEEANGRPVPAGHVVRFADYNHNNFDPRNLRLVTKNDIVRENQAAALARKSREITSLLLRNSQQKDSHDHSTMLKRLIRSH